MVRVQLFEILVRGSKKLFQIGSFIVGPLARRWQKQEEVPSFEIFSFCPELALPPYPNRTMCNPLVQPIVIHDSRFVKAINTAEVNCMAMFGLADLQEQIC